MSFGGVAGCCCLRLRFIESLADGALSIFIGEWAGGLLLYFD
jgi:hypothetical protein